MPFFRGKGSEFAIDDLLSTIGDGWGGKTFVAWWLGVRVLRGGWGRKKEVVGPAASQLLGECWGQQLLIEGRNRRLSFR